jgi:hypothetical protein
LEGLRQTKNTTRKRLGLITRDREIQFCIGERTSEQETREIVGKGTKTLTKELEDNSKIRNMKGNDKI